MLMYYPHIDVTASLGNLAFESTFWQQNPFRLPRLVLGVKEPADLFVRKKEMENQKKAGAFVN